MFNFAFDSYMKCAFPMDELDPIKYTTLLTIPLITLQLLH